MNNVFDLDYKHNKRKHAHRCFKCKIVLKTGDSAVMCRMYGTQKTKACHKHCADTPHVNTDTITTRDVMVIWASPPEPTGYYNY